MNTILPSSAQLVYFKTTGIKEHQLGHPIARNHQDNSWLNQAWHELSNGPAQPKLLSPTLISVIQLLYIDSPPHIWKKNLFKWIPNRVAIIYSILFYFIILLKKWIDISSLKYFLNYFKCSLTLFPTAYFFRGSQGGGWNPPPLWKIHFGVSEPNSFLQRHLYIYSQLKSKRTSF